MVSGVPPTFSVELGFTPLLTSGTVWKYVPFSPAGWRPSFLTWAAMKLVPFTLPMVPASRPCIESSAKAYRSVFRVAGDTAGSAEPGDGWVAGVFWPLLHAAKAARAIGPG